MECTLCKKRLSGANRNNIIRHYKLVHHKEIVLKRKVLRDEKDGADFPIQKKHKISVSTNINKDDFFKCCVGLVAVKNIPMSIFDDQEYFKVLIKPLETAFNTNLNSRNMVKVLESYSIKIQECIKKKLKNQMLSLKLDIATRMDRSIIVINVQYINNYKICYSTIGK